MDCIEQAPAVEASENTGGLLKVTGEPPRMRPRLEIIDDAVERVDHGDEILGRDREFRGRVVGIRHDGNWVNVSGVKRRDRDG